MLLPDTAALRALATTYHDRSADLRDEAAALVARATSAPWQGVAAEAMRAAARAAADRLRATADEHADAGAALAQHAAQVEATLELIAGLRQRFLELAASVGATLVDVAGDVLDAAGALGDAVGAVGNAVGGLGDLVGIGGDDAAAELRDRLSRIRVPAPGDPAWLDLDVPGLR
ncbi:hypothetical protein [Nocardioides zeae]|uniref:Uncharacterized protein n=1 Tax=Nocardioides zeae TaxID=1457234 RepID=A0A6P0HQJ3_9ACTN|nr:hypothetical protein [Nocardioides zeae]NEN79805.1 hypothetical protein [Nocardioides zeae]